MAAIRRYIDRYNVALLREELRARGRTTIAFTTGTGDTGWSDAFAWTDSGTWSDS